MTVHATSDLLGRRALNHPPALTDFDDDASDVAADITCSWCRRSLGLLGETPLTDGPKVRKWTVGVDDASPDAALVVVDADEIVVEPNARVVTFRRDGHGVAGFMMHNVRYWLSDDAEVEKGTPSS